MKIKTYEQNKKNIIYLLVFMCCAMPSYGQQTLINPLVEANLPALAQQKLSTIRQSGGNLYNSVTPVKLNDLGQVMQQNSGLLKINLEGNIHYAYPTNIEKTSNGGYVVRGKFLEEEGDVVFFKEGQEIYGHIRVASGEYDIQSFGTGLNFLVSYNQDEMSEQICGNISPPSDDDGDDTPDIPDVPDNWTPPFTNLTEETEAFCEDDAVRVLVLYTDAAEAALTNVNQSARIAISNTNNALRNSEAFGIRVSLAGVAHLPSFTETRDTEDDLNNLLTNPEVLMLREDHEADLVVVFTGNSYGGVLGFTSNEVDAQPRYDIGIGVVTAANVGNITFPHELGHLFGCKHDNHISPPIYSPGVQYERAHEFQTGWFIFQRWRRTVMFSRYDPRKAIEHYSNPQVEFKNEKTGTSTRNNVRWLMEKVGIVKDYEPYTAVNVLITDKPGCVNASEEFTLGSLTCAPDGVVPVAYQWSVSTDGINYTTALAGTSEDTFTYTMPFSFNLYVSLTVTFSNGETVTVVTTIQRCDLYFDDLSIEDFFGGVADLDDGESGETPSSSMRVATYPNPTVEEITLDYTLEKSENVQVMLQGLDHHNLNQGFTLAELNRDAGEHTEKMQIQGIPSGTYLLTVKTTSILYQNRILIK